MCKDAFFLEADKIIQWVDVPRRPFTSHGLDSHVASECNKVGPGDCFTVLEFDRLQEGQGLSMFG